MSGLTVTPKQVAGRHYPLFETYYLSLDPTGKGQVAAMDAAKFLKRSGLSDAILSKIWDLSDPTGKGFLDKLGVYVGLKLVAFAQNGREVSLTNILDDNAPEPEMSSGRGLPSKAGNETESLRTTQPPNSENFDWTVKEVEIRKYKELYMGLGVEGGKVPGARAKTLLMDSQLPLETLGKIWELADADKDGSLSETEFIIAMHLVYKSLDKVPIPLSLPQELLQHFHGLSSFPRKPSMTTDMPPTRVHRPILIPLSTSPTPPLVPTTSIIPAGVPLIPVKDNWIIPYDERAKFKALFQATDLDKDGFVSGTEIKGVFLQSGLTQQTLAHIWNLCDFDQSGKLTGDQFTLAMWLVSNALKGIQPPSVLAPEMIPPGMVPPKPPPEAELPPEFELLMKETKELTQEKQNLEMEISSKECDKKIKSGETKTLQSELDTLAATLKQLENQKSVAQGKLSELDGQVSALRFQAEEQEGKLSVQESDLSSKAADLETWEKEEQELLSGLDFCGRDIESLGLLLQETLLQISQTKIRLSSLTEVEETMRSSITKYTSAIESTNAYTVTEPELRDVKSELDELLGITSPKYFNGDSRGDVTNSFQTSFDAFSTPQQHPSSGWDQDPFAPVKRSSDPFAPPSENVSSANHGFSSDPFGSVPFEAEVAPALPPKKAPPRPAPPKNVPARPPPPVAKLPPAKQTDPFSQGQGDHLDDGFADFSQFDNQTWGSSNNNNTTNPSNNNNNYESNKRTRNQEKPLPQLEFTEDPFKNYRYEDPFENSDPFAGI